LPIQLLEHCSHFSGIEDNHFLNNHILHPAADDDVVHLGWMSAMVAFVPFGEGRCPFVEFERLLSVVPRATW